MLYEQDKELILKFLTKNYPVYRIKHKVYFKRAIVLDDDIYYLSDEKSLKSLYFKLLDILKIVFSTNKKINEDVLRVFLHLK